MDNRKQPDNKSRRQFFSSLFAGPGETVKMLTPDGKLVEVPKDILQKALQGKKASNKEIFDWMKNPSKES